MRRKPDEQHGPARPDHSYTYTRLRQPAASVTNAQGDTTKYNYNASGDLTSTEYPDDTVETATYDALGDPLVAHRSQTARSRNYTYNAAGQVASETLAGGSTMTLHLRCPGQPDQATDSSGTTTLTYNSADELTSVAYPDGLSLQYTYNAGGQRTQMVEMSGSTVTYTVNYTYNSLGQLAKLTDGTGALIISYTYNNIGELTREDKGDGTYTTYTYDADGNILDLDQLRRQRLGRQQLRLHLQRAGRRNQHGDGRRHLDLRLRQRRRAGHMPRSPRPNPSIPSQNLTYVYNAAGDRTADDHQRRDDAATRATASTNTRPSAVHDLRVRRRRQSGLDDGCLGNHDLHLQFAEPAHRRQLADRELVYQYDALGNLVATTDERPDDRQPGRSDRAGEPGRPVHQLGKPDRRLHVWLGAGEPGHAQRDELLPVRRAGLDGGFDQRDERIGRQLQLSAVRRIARQHGERRQPVHVRRPVRRLERRERALQHAGTGATIRRRGSSCRTIRSASLGATRTCDGTSGTTTQASIRPVSRAARHGNGGLDSDSYIRSAIWWDLTVTSDPRLRIRWAERHRATGSDWPRHPIPQHTSGRPTGWVEPESQSALHDHRSYHRSR